MAVAIPEVLIFGSLGNDFTVVPYSSEDNYNGVGHRFVCNFTILPQGIHYPDSFTTTLNYYNARY
jgi:hypothetical protein